MRCDTSTIQTILKESVDLAKAIEMAFPGLSPKWSDQQNADYVKSAFEAAEKILEADKKRSLQNDPPKSKSFYALICLLLGFVAVAFDFKIDEGDYFIIASMAFLATCIIYRVNPTQEEPRPLKL